MASLASFLSLMVGMSCGYALSRLKFRGSYVILVLVLASQMIPSTSILVPMYALFRDLGLLDTLQLDFIPRHRWDQRVIQPSAPAGA